MKKFKYFPNRINYEGWELDYEVVPNPLPYINLPDGEYMIRGDKKSHRKEYLKYDDIWYLTSTVTKDNGHFICDCTRYYLFPQLSEKEWDKIKKVPLKCLSPLWQRYVHGHNHWLGLRKIGKDMRLYRYQFLKEN